MNDASSYTDNADAVKGAVTVGDIPWTLEPLEQFADVDLLGLSYEDLAVYAFDLQVDRRALRELLHASLAMNHDLRSQLDRALRIIRVTRPTKSGRS